MKTLNLANIVWKEGKYYVSQCLNVDISSFGKTQKQALDNLKEALDLYFEEANVSRNIKPIKNPKIIESALKFKHA